MNDPFVDINENIASLRDKAARLPMEPGVYLMKNSEKKIIYIGKAKLLKNRVNQYFHSFGNLTPKTVKMVSQVNNFDYVVTTSEYEALLLECNLIKQYRPKYNILLKDDKGTHFIRITPPPWSRIETAYRNDDDGSEYIGPYPSGYATKLMVEQAVKVFNLPTCNREFDNAKPSRPCLNFSIKQCYGPCRRGKADPAYHAELISQAKRFLKCGDRETVKLMTEQMQQASEALDFETAARLRDRIRAIESAGKSQTVIDTTAKEADIFAFAQTYSRCCFAVISIRDGRFYNKDNFFIEDAAAQQSQRSDLMADFLLGYYADRTQIPQKVYLGSECDNLELLEQLLSEKRGSKVGISVPQKGEGLRLTQMAAQNASEQLSISIGKQRETGMLAELEKLVGITPLHYIEAYDVSNTAGADNMAALVVFIDGKPQNSNYRRFNIKGFSGQDDYASLREAIHRRFLRYLDPANRDAAFGSKPDIILADGGIGQLDAIKQALTELGITDIPVFGMVKDAHHRTRALVSPDGGEIEIRAARGAFTMVSTIQEEVHRYVITSHRNRRSRRAAASVLDNIPGIGPKRITALMTHFKTIDAIAAASVEELAAVEGMSLPSAERTKRFFEEEY